MPAPFSEHLLQHTVVLREPRVLFRPVPKAGCTSLLWLLSELAGIAPERFAESTLPEPSSALTVHDMNVWEPEHRLAHHEGAERELLLAEDGWLRFTVVRDPWRRLWSAWQSKLLLREPRFADEFGGRAWFPRPPETPAGLVEDFRRFVAALPAGDAEDVHWAVQHELARSLPLTHVGRAERMAETVAALRAHVPARAWREAPRENASPLSLPPHAYDELSAEIVRERYAADFAAYGYDDASPAGGDPREWEARAAPLLPLLRATIDEHARVRQLHRLAQRRAQRLRAVERRLERVTTQQHGRTRSPLLSNLEDADEFAVRWAWDEGPLRPGFTAVVRVRNEARSLPWVLPPLLRAVTRVVLVDNGSTDGTAAVARRVAEQAGVADRLEVRHYPFAVARCGEEHLGTPAASVHSLAHFYNWSFSHVRTGYALKWDGDMVITDAAVAALRDLAWQLEAAEIVVRVPRCPLYVAGDALAFLDTGLRNCEPWAWPNRPGYSFVKAMEWELPMFPPQVAAVTLPDFSCVEIKHLDADEFAHWSPTDFAASPRTARKRRELEVFRALACGGEPPPGVVAVDAPAGVHVIEHVRAVSLGELQRQEAPEQPRSRASRRLSSPSNGRGAGVPARLSSS
jgi:hypothetical protein